MTSASMAAVAAIGAMAAAVLVPAQAAHTARAAASVQVPCDPAALATAVTGAASGATLSLARGCRYVLTAALPTVSQDVTINGRGATLQRSYAPGTPAFTILTVDGEGDSKITATINRLSFRHGNGAISVSGLGAIAVTGGAFTANTAANGGAIDIENTGVNSAVSHARFIRNTATTGSGGAIYDNSPGSDINLDHSTFTGNHAVKDGGALWDFGQGGQLTDSTFRGNTAASGGAIFASENVGEFLSGLVVQNNTATKGGGGIADNGALIQNSKINGNHAGRNGGGIKQYSGTGSPLEVTGTVLQGNTAANGGGIYADSTGIVLTDSTVSGNHATANGGGIDNVQAQNDSSITGSTITGNHADRAGGAFYMQPAPGTGASTAFTSSTISGNHAGTHGGGIYNLGAQTADSTQITGNQSVAGGGGIYDHGPDATTTLTTSPVTGNTPDNCEPTGTITGCTG